MSAVLFRPCHEEGEPRVGARRGNFGLTKQIVLYAITAPATSLLPLRARLGVRTIGTRAEGNRLTRAAEGRIIEGSKSVEELSWS